MATTESRSWLSTANVLSGSGGDRGHDVSDLARDVWQGDASPVELVSAASVHHVPDQSPVVSLLLSIARVGASAWGRTHGDDDVVVAGVLATVGYQLFVVFAVTPFPALKG